MLGKISRLLRQRKGFTLVELMAVIVIIGILAAIAIPVYNNVTVNAAEAAHAANIRILEAAGQMAVFSGLGDEGNVTWTSAVGKETWGDYLDKWPEVPAGANIEWTGYKVTISNGKVEVVNSGGTGNGNGN